MSRHQNWPVETDALDFFANERKQGALAERRPRLDGRRAVGPGIRPSAVRLTNLNDLLATYNGYYSALSTAANAPTNSENFVGFTVMDDELGGRQVFTGLTTGNTYERIFLRMPADPAAIAWGNWKSGGGALATATSESFSGTTVPNNAGYTFLTGPGIVTSGEPTYTSVTTRLNITRPGVYLGFVTINGPSGISGLCSLKVTVPALVSGSTNLYYDDWVARDGVPNIPLLFATQQSDQAVRFEVYQNTGASRSFSWGDTSITRLGDVGS